MKHTLPLITLILALSSFHLDAKPVKAKDIDRQFLAPEMQYRPYVRWWWNGDRVEPQEIIRELQVMQDAGIGGVEISPIEFPSGADTVGRKALDYLSPEWLECLQTAFDETKRLGMGCDLLIGSGWLGKEVIIHDFKEKSINEGFGTGVVGVVRGLTFILKCFIPIIRTVVYYIYSTKQNIYDYFTVQAQMLEMNAYNLQQNNDIDEERKKKAYDKQMKIAAKFRTIANKFAIEDSVATKKAKEMESKEDEKYDADDLAGDVAEGDEDIF